MITIINDLLQMVSSWLFGDWEGDEWEPTIRMWLLQWLNNRLVKELHRELIWLLRKTTGLFWGFWREKIIATLPIVMFEGRHSLSVADLCTLWFYEGVVSQARDRVFVDWILNNIYVCLNIYKADISYLLRSSKLADVAAETDSFCGRWPFCGLAVVLDSIVLTGVVLELTVGPGFLCPKGKFRSYYRHFVNSPQWSFLYPYNLCFVLHLPLPGKLPAPSLGCWCALPPTGSGSKLESFLYHSQENNHASYKHTLVNINSQQK